MGAPPIDIHVCQVLRHTYTLTMVQTLKKTSKNYYLIFPYLLPKPCFLTKIIIKHPSEMSICKRRIRIMFGFE